MTLQLSEIHYYPVKSLRGLALQQATLGPRGLLFDRHWMLVDETGNFLSQRREPRMALIQARLEGDVLSLSAPGMAELELSSVQSSAERLAVSIWRDNCRAATVSADADRWFSDFLGQPCRLVYLPEEAVRAVDPDYAAATDQVGFADGFPLLVVSRASLDDLNSRLPSPIGMEHFRPNLVIDGCAPYAEDDWRRIRIGEMTFRLVKPCSRCIVTTVDPERGLYAGDEPLRTLAGYRRRDNKVFFGQNTLHDGPGELRVGMPVEILE